MAVIKDLQKIAPFGGIENRQPPNWSRMRSRTYSWF